MFSINNIKFIIQMLLIKILHSKVKIFIPVPPPLKRQNANNIYIIQKLPQQTKKYYGFYRY